MKSRREYNEELEASPAVAEPVALPVAVEDMCWACSRKFSEDPPCCSRVSLHVSPADLAKTLEAAVATVETKVAALAPLAPRKDLGFDLEHDERERLAVFVSNGGTIVTGYDEDGAYAILEGTPHVESEGADIVKALRQMADMLEEASR